jgi:hypothetical protein
MSVHALDCVVSEAMYAGVESTLLEPMETIDHAVSLGRTQTHELGAVTPERIHDVVATSQL